MLDGPVQRVNLGSVFARSFDPPPPTWTMAKVLIVENERLIALRIESTLAKAGHQVVGIAATVADALALAAEKKPEIAIVNVSLDRGESGIEFARRSLEQLSLKIVFHSALDDPQVRTAVLAVRPAAFLPKRASGAELVRLVNSLSRR